MGTTAPPLLPGVDWSQLSLASREIAMEIGFRIVAGYARSSIGYQGGGVSYPQTADRRSKLAWLALAAAAISALGIAIILIGVALDIEGAREGEEGSVIFGIAWISYLLGGIAALVLGAVAFVLGRRRNEPATQRAGVIALGYAALAVVIFVIAAAT